MMSKNNQYIVLNEYKSLFVARDGEALEFDGHKAVSEKNFKILSNFVLDVKSNNRNKKNIIKTNISEETIDVLQISQRKINGITRKVLTANSMVGTITTDDGVTVEILPKINNDRDDVKTRRIFLKMLTALRQSVDNKIFNQTQLSSAKIPLLEIFILMFCDEVENLVRRGIQSGYIGKKSNENFLKGKLNVKKQLLYNYIHKERFFVEFDEYLLDIPENRLLKRAISYLFSKTKNGKNKKRLQTLLFIFDDVSESINVEKDFSLVSNNRMMIDYKLSLQWARVFLSQESFSPFYGSSIAFAILFDMNKIFEDYVAHCFRGEYLKVETQKTGKSLIERPQKFNLRPDLFLTLNDKSSIIADTKWKLIDSKASDKNWNISQSDIYQMFAYGKKYNIKKIQLIYPKNENFNSSDEIKKMFFEYYEEVKENNFSLDIKCFDCNKGYVV